MSTFVTKTFVVQKFNHDKTPGEVIGVKLTHAAAHQLAKDHAPAKVIGPIEADKSAAPNAPGYEPDQPPVKLISSA